MIDERAVIHPSAKISEDVHIGPYAVIGERVVIGSGTIVEPHAVIKGPTKIGKNNHIFQFSSIGERPQDLKYAGEETFLEIGDNNTFREFTTINRGTTQDNCVTVIGNHNLFMNYVHVGHDCVIQDHVVMANGVSLAGHVKVESHVVIGGHAGVRQFCTIGAHAFVSMGTFVAKDIPPYVLVGGHMAEPKGINTVGLERREFTKEDIQAIKEAYRAIYRKKLSLIDAVEVLKIQSEKHVVIRPMVAFIENAQRGIVR